MSARLPCGNCGVAIRPEYWNDPEGTMCDGCSEPVLAVAFPAWGHQTAVALPEGVAAEGESSCFHHPASRAVMACESCGRFLCALCDMDLDGRHLCPGCLERGVNDKAPGLDDRRVLYDSMALHLATWPMLMFYMIIFTAPAAVYLAIRHWNTPTSILPRTRARLWIALVLASLQMLAIASLVIFLIWFVPTFGSGGKK